MIRHIAAVGFALPLVMVLGSSSARADEVKRFKAGQPGLAGIAAFGAENSCGSGGAPDVRITRPPANGTTELRKIKHVLESGPCKGNVLHATLVVYKPKAGFKGTDSLTYEYSFDAYVTGTGTRGAGETVQLIVE